MVAKGQYRARGAAADLFFCEDPEVLIEGPAGTGKTRAVLEKINWLCQEVKGARAFICRATRASMTESVLVEFEESVLTPGKGIRPRGGSVERRTAYDYPNGSHMVVSGLDNADRIMSSQYDFAAVFEATEIAESDWDKIQTRMRHNRFRYQQSIADCNPAFRSHWLNRRASRISREGIPMMTRLLSRHEDNPSVTAEYLRRLDNLAGARYERLRLGLWVDESGVVLPEFDERIHVVSPQHSLNPDGTTAIAYYIGAIDWGFRNPGCFQVWGVTWNDEMYRVAEVYFREKSLDWWSAVVSDAHERYNLRTIYCDPAQPEHIAMLNRRLGPQGGRNVNAIAVKANNDWLAGRDLVAELLKPTDGSSPKMYLVNSASRFRGVDKTLREEHLPVCSEEEWPGITWDEAKDDKPIKERPMAGVPDHAFDTTRYAAMGVWGRGLVEAPQDIQLPENSVGAILDWTRDLGDDWQ